MIWHYDHKGSYSIKIGHKLCAKNSGVGVTSNARLEKSWWGKLWSNHIPNKVKKNLMYAQLNCLSSIDSNPKVLVKDANMVEYATSVSNKTCC